MEQKIDISDLSLEEKPRFEQLKISLKEGTDFYWKMAILLLFFWQLIDIILTITFKPFGGRVFGYLPDIPFNVNNMAQLWYQLPVLFMLFGFFVSLMSIKEVKRKKLAATLIITIWAAFFIYIATREPWIKDTIPRQVAGGAEFLCFLGITIFLAIKAKWSRFICVVAAYLVVLLVLYYGFYRSITLVVEWSPSPPSFSNPPFGVLIGHIMPVLGIISALMMAWASSTKGRKWLALSHVQEERQKAEKRQA